MSWIEENAIKRIYNTFRRVPKQIFKEDVQALKTLNDAIESYNKKQAQDNLLYSKLLCVVLNQNLVHYSDMQTAIKKTSDDLKLPLDYHLQFLHTNLNNLELENYFKSLGLKNWKNESELSENKSIIKEQQKEMIDKIKSSWSFDTVEKSFYKTANTFLKDVNNYE